MKRIGWCCDVSRSFSLLLLAQYLIAVFFCHFSLSVIPVSPSAIFFIYPWPTSIISSNDPFNSATCNSSSSAFGAKFRNRLQFPVVHYVHEHVRDWDATRLSSMPSSSASQTIFHRHRTTCNTGSGAWINLWLHFGGRSVTG